MHTNERNPVLIHMRLFSYYYILSIYLIRDQYKVISEHPINSLKEKKKKKNQKICDFFFKVFKSVSDFTQAR